MNDCAFGMVMSFNDQSESYTLGFECGMIWELLRQGVPQDSLTVHAANIDQLHKVAWHYGMKMFVDRTPEYSEWCVVAFSRAPKERHLNLVKPSAPDYVDD